MFDSHCHLDDDAYRLDCAEVIERAAQAGVVGILVPGYAPDEWAGLKAFCTRSPLLRCAVGLHPWYVHRLTEEALSTALAGLSAAVVAQGAVAIGECGLDKRKAAQGGASLSLQSAVLDCHLRVADELALPLILHCVEAHGALLTQLEAHGPLPAAGVLHSYSGPAELIPRYAALGLSFSFGGMVTREAALKPRRAATAVPLSRLLVESDGPDQPLAKPAMPAVSSHSPQTTPTIPGRPARPRTEPADVARVLDVLATLRSETREMVAHHTTCNALRLFDRARV